MNKKQFEELKEQLTDHHRRYIKNECTADPIYLVKKKVIDWGYEEEYASHHQLAWCDSDGYGYETIKEFLDNHDQEEWDYLFGETDYNVKEDFELYHSTLQDVCDTMQQLQPYNGWEMWHGNERWETINIYITWDAAMDFMKSKGWEYGNKNVMIYVDSLYRSKQLQGLLDLVIDGKLEFKDE